MLSAELNKQNGRILLIEQNKQLVIETTALLNKENYHVETFDCLIDAVEMLAHNSFDCAIVNVDIRGTRRCDSVRIFKIVAPELPVIAIAEKNNRELETEVRQLDIFYYHLKDFSAQELLVAIQGACLKKGKKRMKQLGRR